MKKILILLIVLVVTPLSVRASYDAGVVSTADYIRFPVIAVDSNGITQPPDSGHVLVWYEGEATANSASYTTRWIDGGASGSYIDSTVATGATVYYFVDLVADIDNGEGTGVYTGEVVLFTAGLPFSNPFSFTLAGDELADYWANVSTFDPAVDSVSVFDLRLSAIYDLFNSSPTTWGDSALTTFGHLLSLNDSSLWYDGATLAAKLDTLAMLSGFFFGATSKYVTGTDVDTLKIITNSGADTVAYVLRHHPGGAAGGSPDSTSVASGPDR